MKKTRTINLQSGAVSLFMVIFAMLLMSVVTISFLRIMTSDQSQASNNDLSQSAYDSALAGVEDAKRALLWHVQQCQTNPGVCDSQALQMATTECNAAIRIAGVVKDGDYFDTAGGVGTAEVKVQQSTVNEGGESIDAALDQAYTCVTLLLNTDDYTAPLLANQSKLIPLVSTAPFSTITIQWFSRDDVPNTTGSVNALSIGASARLPLQADWPTNRPSLMRAQYMQVGDDFTLKAFDSTQGAESNANTIFLYPASNGLTSTELTSRDVRRDQDGTVAPADQSSAPTLTRCETIINKGDYACSMTLSLPAPIGGGNAEAAYLRLLPLYNSTHIRVTLGNNAQFRGVQPIVDSTGRANDLFRRVQSRIDMHADFPYPDAALDVNGNLCKDFGVTDVRYIAGNCAP